MAVVPSSQAYVEPAALVITPDGWSTQSSVKVVGQPDWISVGDKRFSVVVGPCVSADRRFDGMGFPDNPAVSKLTMWNVDVPMPLITKILPSAVHVSGWAVTVFGSNIDANCRITFGPYVIHDSRWANAGDGAIATRRRSRSAWSWVYNNATQTRQPIRTELLRNLTTVQVDGQVVLLDHAYNKTLCDVMRDEGLLLGSNSNDTFVQGTNATDRPPPSRVVSDPRLGDLLQYSWLSDKAVSFVTPCALVRTPATDRCRLLR